MLTREQIEEIHAESREKGISVKNPLKHKGIHDHQYFWWKLKYSKPEVPEGFLPVAGSGLPSAIVASTCVRHPSGNTDGRGHRPSAALYGISLRSSPFWEHRRSLCYILSISNYSMKFHPTFLSR